MIANWVGERCFRAIHRRNLVYNTCWEDPRLDHEALQLSSDDSVMVITSAGCNALDYLIEGPRHVHAVDLNPLQNALLELKVAAIRALPYEDFFRVFGTGCAVDWSQLYGKLRPLMPSSAQACWDRRADFFDGSRRRSSFYFRGSSGYFAWLINAYIDRVAKIRDTVMSMLEADTLGVQQDLFRTGNVSESLWRPLIRWLLRRDTTMSMLGVPRSQRRQIDRDYVGGIEQFIIDRVETVFTQMRLADNYFWRVYLTGAYTPECCPRYLTPEGFAALQGGLVDRLTTHTDTVEGFLRGTDDRISRFVLLDHMDWLWESKPELLASEWQAIFAASTPTSRALWRSAGLKVDFVDPLQVTVDGRPARVGDRLTYHTELAESLHRRDRVNTYGSFYVADVHAA